MKTKGTKIYFDGVSAQELAKGHGTPLYVYETGRIRENYRRLYNAFQPKWSKFKIYYAVKANSNPAIIRILMEEGAGCDCASANEILLAQKLGAKGDQILFSGNYLTDEDLKVGLSAKALFNLDDLSLLPRLLQFGRPEILSLRINPGIGKSNVHESDVMAGKQAKFGIPWEKAIDAYSVAKKTGIGRFGVHMMTGSCVTDPNYFAEISEKLLDCVGPIAQKLKIQFDFINIGGGFGIPYAPGEEPLDIEETAALVTKVFRKKVSQYGLGEPRLVVEPGRYLVGDAGFLIGRVHAIKESYKKFVGTDVGMNVLARPVLYGAYHNIYVDTSTRQHVDTSTSQPVNQSKGGTEVVTITGQACENADAWAKDRKLTKIDVGDLIVVENAGAYGYVMSYPYNGRLRAAEVLVDGKTHRLIRRRETLEDWLESINL